MKKNFIGIDFSKEKFDATMLLTVDGMVKSSDCPYSSFGNNQKGFKKFTSWIAEQTSKANKEDILLCGELWNN